MEALYGRENAPTAQDVIEGRLIQIGLRALELGNNVVIDYGLWSRGALRTTTGSSRSRCEGGDVLFRSHPRPSSGDDLISARPKRHTRRGPTKNLRSGPPISTSQPQSNSTAVNLWTTHRLASRHGTNGAIIAGCRRSSDLPLSATTAHR